MLWFLTGLYCTLYSACIKPPLCITLHYTHLHRSSCCCGSPRCGWPAWWPGWRPGSWSQSSRRFSAPTSTTPRRSWSGCRCWGWGCCSHTPSADHHCHCQLKQARTFSLQFQLKHVRQTDSTNGPIPLRPVVNISVVCFSSAPEGLWVLQHLHLLTLVPVRGVQEVVAAVARGGAEAAGAVSGAVPGVPGLQPPAPHTAPRVTGVTRAAGEV